MDSQVSAAPWSAKNLMTSLEECKCLPSGRAPRQIKWRSYETGNYPGLEPPLPTGRPKIEPCGSDSEAAGSSFQHRVTGKN